MSTHTLKNPNVGIWIDHKEAFVVFDHVHNHEAHSTSELDKHIRHAEHFSESGNQTADQGDKRFQAHINRYYDDVITHLQCAEAILILGPGEAKGEFKKRLESKGFGSRIAGIETADKLTNHQMSAKVLAYFHQ